MPKQVLNIENFSKGLNNRTNPRDLAMNEFQALDMLSTETPGTVKVMGASYGIPESKSNSQKSFNTAQTINQGNGLFHYNSDRDLDNGTVDNSESLFLHSPYDKNISIFDYTDNAWVAGDQGTISYGTTSALVQYHVVDGEIRISPYPSTGTFSVNNRIKWYGYLNNTHTLGDTSGPVPITNGFTGHKSDDMYISPIKSNTSATDTAIDEWGYDYESALSNTTFSAKWGSEISLNEGLPGYYGSADGEQNNTSGIYTLPTNNTNPDKMGVTSLATIISYMNNYQGQVGSESADYIAGFGTMRMYAWFNMRTTAADDDDSDIYVYKPLGGDDDKKYALFASNIYGRQESHPVHIGYIAQPTLGADQKRKLYYSFFGRMPNKPRQTGINIYYAKSSQNTSDVDVTFADKYLLFEINFKKGLRIAGKDNYRPFSNTTQYDANNTIASHGTLSNAEKNSVRQYCYPDSFRASDDCTSINGKGDITELPLLEPYIYTQPTAIGRPGTGYKTSTILNRRAYIGNVAYYDEDNKIVHKNDTVLKSGPNEFDSFEIDRRLDVEINDGDDIVKLASVGDKLLEFKKKTLYIISTSRDVEILEATIAYKGVEKDYHVVEGDGFVAWFNKYGIYLYDGQNFRDILIDEETGQKRLENWVDDYYNDNSTIGYIPSKESLIITHTSGKSNNAAADRQKVLLIDLKSLGINYGSVRMTNEERTNLQNLNNGTLLWYDKAASIGGQPVLYDLSYWRPDPSKLVSSTDITANPILKTPSYVMQAPHLDKVITTVYISYKNGNNVTVKGFTDTNDGGSAVEHTIATLSGTNDTTFRTKKIKMRSLSTTIYDAFKKVKSFGLIFSGSNMEDDFEINDLQIVFRPKGVK